MSGENNTALNTGIGSGTQNSFLQLPLDPFPTMRTLRPRIPRAPLPARIPRSERIPKGSNTTPTSNSYEVLRTNLFLSVFLTSDLHPQLVTMIFHYHSINVVNVKFWAEVAPGFLLEASRISTPLEVAAQTIKQTCDSIVANIPFENPLVLLKRMRNEWYKSRWTTWNRVCESAKNGNVSELLSLPIEQHGPWPESFESLKDYDEFNVHTIEYKAFAPLKCSCYSCLEGRYGHIQDERSRALGRAKNNALNVAMDELGKSRRFKRAFVDIAYSVSNPEAALDLHLEKQNLVIETEALRAASSLLRLFHSEEALLLAGDAAFVSQKAINMRKLTDVYGAALNQKLCSEFVDTLAVSESRKAAELSSTMSAQVLQASGGSG